ncbi:hypothetical protein QOZ88_06030 [Blastococcus sp. BMG 814]|uniref:Uncharacterized protein n=1 Tax=Blastococcus carthaginiensis TaxID=3050034 RepID=A0ABT9I9F0_9ACTN|nr:hypothetical protein [Blastococcus carthaginiensis]MDP5182189.1 hypothetical protein [Blastococcus carthaginiensis]
MTVPVQRDGPDSGVLGFVAESLRRLEDSVARGFADVNNQLSRLPNDYVPRRELDRRLDEFTFDIAELRKHRETDAAERANARRWLIGLAVTGALSATGVVSGIVLHFT